ncbi:carbohydrate kinase [Massilia sp. 9096]|uniref:carbohydrate kinase n=1 Tax=Massilia sp. 9096 TaxID=1500894 RepID=UPI00056CB73D|nr:carbohydrate kinase [Massilia sp. 9096]
MTEQTKKQQLLELIRSNPFISQQDLAVQLGLSRSAVAGHIAGLIRERKLLGRAYVLPAERERRPVACVGAANLDRKLRSTGPLTLRTSNPASAVESFGGVARNIAENLARLGTQVALLTAIGNDSSGAALLAHAESLGIDTRGALRFEDAASGTYTAVLDQDGDMVVALADMALYDRVDAAFVASRQAQLASAALVVADLNLPLATVDALVQEVRRGGMELVLVAVSEPKMARLPRDLRGAGLLILNAGELGARVGRTLAREAEIEAAMREVQAQGVRDLVVTRGADGVMLTTPGDVKRLAAPDAQVVDVTGAGDAFAAAVCWSLLQAPAEREDAGGSALELACRRGLALSKLTLGAAETVYPGIGPQTLADVI